jgi:deoxycytidine triphosphate deaminase
MIKNYKKENIGPVKYSFRLGELFKHGDKELVDLEKNEIPALIPLKLPYIIKPGEYVIGRTIEEFDMPLDLMSIYAMKSQAFRIGLNILCGTINDPGYKGKAIMGIQNISQNDIKLFVGMGLMSTTFLELTGDAIPIQTKYMGGKIL